MNVNDIQEILNKYIKEKMNTEKYDSHVRLTYCAKGASKAKTHIVDAVEDMGKDDEHYFEYLSYGIKRDRHTLAQVIIKKNNKDIAIVEFDFVPTVRLMIEQVEKTGNIYINKVNSLIAEIDDKVCLDKPFIKAYALSSAIGCVERKLEALK